MGKVQFGQMYLNLGSDKFATLDDANKAGAPVIRYGAFLQTVFDFIIVAFVIFMVIRQMNKLTPKKKA
jgi:large conductance mechanosensitive channel